MVTSDKGLNATVKFPDPAELATDWPGIFSNSVGALRDVALRTTSKPAPMPYDPHAPTRAMADVVTSLWSDPMLLVETQRKLFGEWTELWATAARSAFGHQTDALHVPEKGDRRFNDPGWSEPFFDYLKQAYLLTTRQTLDLVANSDLDAARGRARTSSLVSF